MFTPLVVQTRAVSGSPPIIIRLLLVRGHRDGSVRVQHHLGAAYYGHQQEGAEQEHEEEGKAQVHVHVKPGNREESRVHVLNNTEEEDTGFCWALVRIQGPGLLWFCLLSPRALPKFAVVIKVHPDLSPAK